VSAVDIIQDRRVFSFAQARVVVEPVLDQYAATGMEDTRRRTLGEYVLLCAAEFESVRAFAASAEYVDRNGGPRAPLTVGPSATWEALVKCDCIPYEDPCPWARAAGGAPPRWSDTLLFAGDMHKVGPALDELGIAELPRDMTILIEVLERRHNASPVSLGQTITRSGLLRVQGLLWQARLSLLSGGEEEAERQVSEYLDKVPLWGEGSIAGETAFAT
jgi:hypothetical protein